MTQTQESNTSRDPHLTTFNLKVCFVTVDYSYKDDQVYDSVVTLFAKVSLLMAAGNYDGVDLIRVPCHIILHRPLFFHFLCRSPLM